MSAQVRNWLPPEAAIAPRVRDALEGVVDAWSGKWFPGIRAELSRVEAYATGRAGDWLVHCGAVALPVDGPEAIRLAGLALGADTENLILSEPDRDIVGRFAAVMLADLAATLSSVIGLGPGGADAPVPTPDPLAGESGIELHICDAAGRPLVRAVIPLSALVPFIKAGIPARRGPELARIDGPVGRTATRLDIRLGGARLSLGDLAGLSAGDVLVLDRIIETGASVSLSTGERTPFAGAILEPDCGTTRLILTHQRREN